MGLPRKCVEQFGTFDNLELNSDIISNVEFWDSLSSFKKSSYIFESSNACLILCPFSTRFSICQEWLVSYCESILIDCTSSMYVILQYLLSIFYAKNFTPFSPHFPWIRGEPWGDGGLSLLPCFPSSWFPLCDNIFLPEWWHKCLKVFLGGDGVL